MSRIIITGGNGFIGSHITRCFEEHGEDIIHPTSRELDILDKEALCHAFKGADAVIHNAARAIDWGSPKEFHEINVLGTRNVLHACVKNGIRKVLMTGSCSVFGEEHHPEAKDENSPRDSHYRYFLDGIFPCAMNYYRDSKRVAAVNAASFARRHKIDLTIFHPVWVYGEQEFHTGFYEYLSTAKSGVPVMMGSQKNNFHVIYAGDLARAYYLAYEMALPGVREYIVGDENPVSMELLYQKFCTEAGFKKPANLPKALIYPAAFLMELGSSLLRRTEPPLLTRGRVNMFYDSINYSGEKIRRELGFACEHTLEDGIARTVRWYKENGHL